ncbi:MAG: sodium:calcium antiporter [Mycobacteriales bacterium]
MIGFALLALSAVLLVAGAKLFVDNTTGADRRLRVAVFAIGLLLAGAEPEEMLTAVLASLAHRPGLAVGDALGANVTMLTLTLGLAAVIRPVPIGRRVRSYALLAAVAGVLGALTVAGGLVTRPEGALLIAAYAGLVALIWWREREPPLLGELAEMAEDDEKNKVAGRSPLNSLLLALLGVAVMTAGGRAAIAGAIRVVDVLGASDNAVGLTFLALATTAELFALVWAAARRGATEIAVAGVVGSAAYNATATLGAAALVRPLAAGGLLAPAVLAAALPLVVVGLAPRGRLGRPAGLALLAGYAAYAVLVFR